MNTTLRQKARRRAAFKSEQTCRRLRTAFLRWCKLKTCPWCVGFVRLPVIAIKTGNYVVPRIVSIGEIASNETSNSKQVYALTAYVYRIQQLRRSERLVVLIWRQWTAALTKSALDEQSTTKKESLVTSYVLSLNCLQIVGSSMCVGCRALLLRYGIAEMREFCRLYGGPGDSVLHESQDILQDVVMN
eukprot:SAG31_NODE_4252_length_3417_cov_1.831826_4_plen_188_part_00